MTDRELMQQALEALLWEYGWGDPKKPQLAAIAALRERLAQPEQEPFCFHDGRNIVGKEYADHSDVFPLYTSPNPEQQKPVRFNCTVIDDAHLNGVPLSQWVGLTDDEMEALFLNEDGVRFARYIESRLKDKNA